jgi:O-antigen ligase
MSVPVAVRRALLVASLLVPLVMDPFGADTQAAKAGLLALVGGTLLALEGAAVVAGRLVPRTTGPEALLLLLAAWSAASLAWAANPALGLSRVLGLVGLLGLVRGVRAEVERPAAAQRWLAALLAAGVLAVGVDALLLLRAREDLGSEALKHASQVFVHNNMAAGFVTALLPLAIAGALAAAGWRRTAGGLAVLVALLGYLGLLQSRAGLLAALLSVLVTGGLFLLLPRLQRAGPPGRRALLVAGGLVLAAALLPLSDTARGLAKDVYYATVRMTGLQLTDASFRPDLWRKSLEMVAERPLGGVGAGNFPVEIPRFDRYQAPKPHAHNDALQLLAETGLPGLLLFLGLLAGTGLLLARGLAGRSEPERFVVQAALAGQAAVLVASGFFEVPLALAATQAQFAWLLGLCGALQRDGSVKVARGARGLGAVMLLAGVLAAGLAGLRLPASWLMARAAAAGAAAQQEGLPESQRVRLLEEALALHGRAAQLGTGAYHPEREQARIALALGRSGDALAHVLRARALAPHSVELLVLQGDMLGTLERWAEAADCYAAAVRATPRADEPFWRLQLALDRSGQPARAVEAYEQRVREDADVDVALVIRLADAARRLAFELEGDEQERALVRARHWYAVVAQEDPARRADFDAIYRDLTHRLQVRPGAPDSWFKGTYRRWLDQGGWGIPGPALFIGLAGDERRLYPGWELPPEAFAPGTWRHPSVWKEP